MKKLLSILFVFALALGFMAGEKRVVGARVNNQIMLLRIDLANYAMDCSTDGTNWNDVKMDWSNVLNGSGVALLSGAAFTGNVSVTGTTTFSGMTATTVPYLNASKALTSSAVTPTELGYLSGVTSAIQTQIGTKITAPSSPAQGDIIYFNGTSWASLTAGTSGQYLKTQGTGANPIWATPVGSGDVTGPSSSTDSHLAAFDGATGKIIKDSGVAASGFATSGANSNITSLNGLITALSIGQGGTGLSTLGSAGQVLKVNSGATALEFGTVSSGMSNPMTAAGDLIYGGSSGTPSRLGIGTAGQVLTVNSGATAAEWAAASGGVTSYLDLTNKPIDISTLGDSYDGHYLRFGYAASGGLDSYVKLLIHADGANGETTFTDSSSTGRTITVSSGTVSKSTSVKKFGTASALFGGGYLNLANDNGFDVGSGDFTIDFWMYPTSSDSRQALFFNTTDTYGVGMEFNFGGTRNVALWATATYGAWDILQSDTDGQASSGIGATSIPLNEWTHVALVRSGNVWMLFINGILDISRTRSGTVLAGSQDKAIGGGIAYRNAFSGYIDEFRFSKGIARWTSGFTPPVSAYSADVTRALYVDSSVPPYITAPSSPAQGDILYYSGSAWAKLAAGTSGQYLQTQGASANPQWAAVTGTGGLLKASGSGYALDNGSTGRGTVGEKAVSLEYSSSGSTYGATGSNATVSGGLNNTASGTNSTVSGGSENTASETDSTVSGGYSNTASGNKSTVSGGAQNTASGTHSTVNGGLNNTASGNYSTAGGSNGISSHHGENSYSSGIISVNGDCQRGSVQARISTSSTDAATLYLDGSSAKFTLSSGDHYSCRVHLIGAQADGSTGDYYAIVKIKNVSGTTSLSGTVRVLEAWEGDTNLGTPTIAITADDTNDCLQVAVTPANATATRWTAVVEYVKINY